MKLIISAKTIWGRWYGCDTCSDFCLCFKCYRSRDILYPDHLFHNSHDSPEYEDNSSAAGSTNGSEGTADTSNSEDEEGSEAEEESSEDVG